MRIFHDVLCIKSVNLQVLLTTCKSVFKIIYTFNTLKRSEVYKWNVPRNDGYQSQGWVEINEGTGKEV